MSRFDKTPADQRATADRIKWLVGVVDLSKKEFGAMAKTKTSTYGKQQQKIVPVRAYRDKNGKRVKAHRRSTPN